MDHEINIYTRREDPISLDDIRAQMRARGTPVEWKPAPLTDHLGPTRWMAGRFAADDAPQADIVAGREKLSTSAREELERVYSGNLTPAQRAALLASVARYGLKADGPANQMAERILTNLVDVIAELGDGLIHDLAARQFHDRGGYRASHSALLGGRD